MTDSPVDSHSQPETMGRLAPALSIYHLAMRSLLRSKIHLATVTEANLDYVGSITIDRELIDAVGLWPGEKVLVASNTTGARLETYVIEGERGSGVIGINGAAAHLINAGEKVIIMGFELCEKPVEPKVIFVDGDNQIIDYLHEKAGETVSVG